MSGGGDPATLVVNEIFLSIQGESTRAGLPCVFVRTAGCPLFCRWCDTRYASTEAGVELTLAEIVRRVASYGVPRVELTGGEPLVQPAALALLAALADTGAEVLLETSGAFDIAPVDARVAVIMDIKCPDAGAALPTRWDNLERLRHGRDELKLVVASRGDYDYARRTIGERRLDERCEVLLSPASGLIEPRQLVEWMLADRLPARFQLQLHKQIWPADARGV